MNVYPRNPSGLKKAFKRKIKTSINKEIKEFNGNRDDIGRETILLHFHCYHFQKKKKVKIYSENRKCEENEKTLRKQEKQERTFGNMMTEIKNNQ